MKPTKDEALRMALEALENPFGVDEYNRSIADMAIVVVRDVLEPQFLIGNTLFPSPDQFAEMVERTKAGQSLSVRQGSCGHESCDCRSYCKNNKP